MRTSFFNLPAACWKRILLNLINDISGGATFFFAVYFVTELHLSIVSAGILVSSYGLGTVAGGILGGKSSDRFSMTITANISLFIKALTFFLLVKLQLFIFLILNLFSLGIATYSFKTVNNVWTLALCSSSETEKLKAINMLYISSNIGIGLSAILVSLFVSSSFRPLFLFCVVLIALCLIFNMIKNTNKELNYLPLNEQTPKNNLANKNKNLLSGMLVCVFLIGLIIAQLNSTYPLYLHTVFPVLGTKAVGILFLLNTILIATCQAPLINSLQHSNKVFAAGIGAFLYGFGMLLLCVSYTFAIAIVSCVIYTIGEMIFMTMAQLVCYQQGGEKKKGQSLGLYQSIFASSIVIGPTIGSLIYHHFNANLVWYSSGLIGLISMFICFYLKKYWATV